METPEQAIMTSYRRTEFAPFVLDILDFMEERIREAIADEGSRASAIGEAAGVIPLLRDRLREDETKQAQFMLVFDNQMYDADAARWWTDLGLMERPAFETRAAGLVGPHGILAVLRTVVDARAENIGNSH
jgi:hypothetical protein